MSPSSESDFLTLLARFWNSSLRAECPVLDDSQGITLYSLGGVFISTGVGLVIAMVVLAAEVMYYKQDKIKSSSGSLRTKISPIGNSVKVNPKKDLSFSTHY